MIRLLMREPSLEESGLITLGLQKAQSRYYLQTLGPQLGIICILGAMGVRV